MGNSIPCRTAQEQQAVPFSSCAVRRLAATFKPTSVLPRCDGAPIMYAISDNAVSQQSLAASSIATYRTGKSVLSPTSTIGRLLILKEGVVPIGMEGVEKATEPGAVFGELSASLDQPHTAGVYAKHQVHDRQLSSFTRKTIATLEESLGASGGNLAYAGYPYDPFALDTVEQ